MITIITGTPGAGKTLYTVTKLVRGLVGTTVKHVANGAEVELPRIVYTNIKGLTLDHELIDGGGTWKKNVKTDVVEFVGDAGGLRDWHLWAKPGSVIVFDEVQKVWEPRANGAWVPPDIQALETHRHMGVDFVLITQGLSLTERNLSMLCNRHLHVRRVANMPFAVVYEWDHASRNLMYSRSITNSKWWYDRKGYALYKSAEVHTKQARSVPKAAIVGLAGLLLLGVLVPVVYNRFGERFGWVEAKAATEVKKPASGPEKTPPVVPAASVAVVASSPEEKPKFVGCASTATRCTCFDADNTPIDKPFGFCKLHTDGMQGPPIKLDKLVIPEQDVHVRHLAMSERDAELLAFAGARELAQGRLRASPKAPSH